MPRHNFGYLTLPKPMKRSFGSLREPYVDPCPGAPSKRRGRVAYRARSNYSTKRITYLTRTVEKTAFTTLGAAWFSQKYSFTLGDLPFYTELTSLFDQYKIEKVKMTFFPRYSENTAPNTASVALFNTNTILWNVSSDDGTTLLPTQNNALQCMAAKMRSVNEPFSVWVKPKYQLEAATSLAIASARPSTGFIDCDNYSVIHSGHEIAGYSPGAPSNQATEWKGYSTYYLALKSVS